MIIYLLTDADLNLFRNEGKKFIILENYSSTYLGKQTLCRTTYETESADRPTVYTFSSATSEASGIIFYCSVCKAQIWPRSLAIPPWMSDCATRHWYHFNHVCLLLKMIGLLHLIVIAIGQLYSISRMPASYKLTSFWKHGGRPTAGRAW